LIAEFNDQSKQILELVEKERNLFKVVGSELLLLALTKTNNSSCKLILNDYGVNQYTLEKEIERLVIMRKNSRSEEYTLKYLEIIKNAKSLAMIENSKLIFEEHLFYALLTTPSTVAIHILEKLGLEISDLIEDLNNIYSFGPSNDINNNYLINITKEAKLDRLNPFIGREETIDKIIRILSKKQKNNPMLIGSAGVGKSALVEGVAFKYLEINPNINIYRLDLGTVIAGTKYRGDLEERLLDVIDKIKNPNAIVFIDEIHNIVGSGSSEGTLDIANILKPILARSEIKCIGATTLDEYYKYIEKDKALSRRFQNVFIDEASPKEAYKIIKGIAYKYEQFHKVKYDDYILEYIITSSNFLSNRKLPDKAIDVLDEAGLVCNLNSRKSVTKEDIDKIIYESLGIKYYNIFENLKGVKNYRILNKYYKQYFMNLGIRKTILNIQTAEENLELFTDDIKKVFNIKDEVILTLDLARFQEAYFSSSLIGSPAGYVGYEDGGILTEHVIKFPISVIIIKNYYSGNIQIKKQLEGILQEGKIVDSKGRLISFKNSFFIFVEEESMKSIGFITSETSSKKTINPYIDEVLPKINRSKYYHNKLQNILDKMKDFNYNISVDIKKMNQVTYSKLVKELSNIDNFKPNKKYIVKCVNDKILFETLKRS